MENKILRAGARLVIASAIYFLIPALFLNLTACSTVSPPPQPAGESAAAYKEGVPGGVFVNTVKVSARVAAIDRTSRKITLLGPDGEKLTAAAGPEAINFDQVKVGDLVKAVLTEELVVYVDSEGSSPGDGAEAVVALAPKGAKPGGLVAQTTQVTATVKAIDTAARTATLKFENGVTRTIRVRDDIDLSLRRPGEKVVFLITEMVAISVEKP